MKKLKIVLISFLFILVSACVSDDDVAEVPLFEGSSTELLEGVRKFPAFTDYEDVLELKNLQEIPDFVSFADLVNSPKNSKSEIARVWQEDDFLRDFSNAYVLKILDSNGMVIIGDFLIKLDFNSKKAFVTKNLGRISNFKEGQYDFKDVSEYDFEDDVLEDLFGDTYSGNEVRNKGGMEDARLNGTGCPGSFSPGSTFPSSIGDNCDSRKCQWTSIYSEAGWSYKAEAKHVYQAAAIYFRLKSEIAHFKNNQSNSTGWSTEPSPGMTITYWGSFKPKNRSTVNISSCYDQCQGCGPIIANRDKVQKIHWEAGRRLTSYNLYGIFEVHLGGNHAQSGYPDVFQLHNIQR